MKASTIASIATIWLAGLATAHAGTTFDAVKSKGYVQCGVSDGISGFSSPDSKGVWKGLDISLCQSFAAAMFNDASRFKVTPVSSAQRFTALQSGEIDVLTRSATQTMTRDTSMGLIGAGVSYYDGQGIMVAKSMGIDSAKNMNGATICVSPGTTTEMNLADWFHANGIQYHPLVIDNLDEMTRAFGSGRCDAMTHDKAQLAGIRAGAFSNPDDYVILPEALSKEPLGPQVRQGDEQWFNLVRWTLNALFEAEEYGITSQNVDDMLGSSNPNVQRILGVTPGMGKNLGVDDKWAYNIIKQVGNYGEIFESTIGSQSPLKLERGINAQWRDGGLIYGWPIR